MNTLNWSWILVGATVPAVGGLLVAYPIWRMNQPILGNLAGSAVIFGAAIALIMREHVALDRQVQACLAARVYLLAGPFRVHTLRHLRRSLH